MAGLENETIGCESEPGTQPQLGCGVDKESAANNTDQTENTENTENTVCVDKQAADEQTVCKFYLGGKCRFGAKCLNLHPSGPLTPQTPRKSKTKNKKTRDQADTAYNSNVEKLPSMKTVDHVISRLMWDDDIPQENFTVGYLDRFVGIIEQPFSSFSWEDIASVDNNVLSVPRHRIQFFKYRGYKVWDKNERLDIMFGSTGNKVSIRQFMNSVDEKLGTDGGAAAEAAEIVPQDLVDVVDGNGATRPTHFIGGAAAEMVPRDKVDVVDRGGAKRPTHFVCIRVNDAQVIAAAKEMVQSIQRCEPAYSDHFLSLSGLHITVALMRLDDVAEHAAAVDAFNESCGVITCAGEPIKLEIDGLDTFNHHVLFGKVSYLENFRRFIEQTTDHFRKAGIRLHIDRHEYRPHLTLLKTSSAPRDKRIIDPALYRSIQQQYFGIQVIDNLQLCSISEKTDDGFYRCIASFGPE